MEKQRWCLFGWSVYPKDGIRLLLCGWLGFGAFGSWGAYAAPPSSSLRVQILRARKDAFRIRAYEKQIWDIERWFADEPADQKATEKKIAETTDKKSAAIWKKSLRLRLENTKRNQALAQKMRRYLRYLESREQLIGKQRWRGHLYYHPTRGLLKGKAEGAELIVPVEAWRTHCVQQKPYAYDPPKERPLRVLAWGKSKWWVKEFQVAHREQPKPMHPERRYLYISSPSQYDLCRPRPFFLWDMNTQTLIKVPPPPLAEMFGRHPELLPWLQHPSLRASFRLLSFDAARQSAVLLFSRSRYTPRGSQQKTFLLHWDLAAQQIRQVTPLPHHTCEGKTFLDPKTQTFFSLEPAYTQPEYCFWYASENLLSPRLYKTSLMAFHWPTGQLHKRLDVLQEHKLYDFRFDRHFKKWLIVEYHQRFQRPVYAFVYDLRSGKRLAHRISAFNYGLAFSADEQHVFVGSADKGFVYRFPVASKQRARKVKVGAYIHAVGISQDGREVYAIRHGGIHALSAKNLKKLRVLPISALTGSKKETHVGGSLIEKGTLFVRLEHGKRIFVLWPKR